MGIPKKFHLYWRISYYSLYSFLIEKKQNKRNGKQKHSISNRLVTISSLTNCFSWTNPFCQGVHCTNPISGSHQRRGCQQIWSWLDSELGLGSSARWMFVMSFPCFSDPCLHLFRGEISPIQSNFELPAVEPADVRYHIYLMKIDWPFCPKYWNTVSIFLSAVDSGVYKYLIRFEKMVNCRLKSTSPKFMEQQMFTLQKTVLKKSWGPTDC